MSFDSLAKQPSKFIAEDPELSAAWDYDKNTDKDIKLITRHSNKKAWWRCSKGHSYEAIIGNRSRKGSGCPYCLGRALSDDNSLAVVFPYIASEWHPTKNGDKSPEQYSRSSNARAWWRCCYGHDYSAKINNRTNGGTSCPYCSGIKVSTENSLSYCFPDIASEWHPTKNDIQTPDNIAKSSNKNVWWRCSQAHEFEAVVASRTKLKSPCPICTNKRISNSFNLKGSYPELMIEWDAAKNYGIDPETLFPGTPIKAWWICHAGHSFEMPINKRTLRSYNCPYCSGQKLTPENSLGYLFPDIAKEWHPTKNMGLLSSEVSKSSNKKVWWVCPRGHDYQATPNARTYQGSGTGCPKCTRHTSKSELRMLAELQPLFPNIISRDKSFGIEIDLYIPDLKIGIEYDGAYFHAYKLEADKKKHEILSKQGVVLLRVRQSPLDRITPDDILSDGALISKSDIDKIVQAIFRISKLDDANKKAIDYISQTDFTRRKDHEELLKLYPGPIPSKSLEQVVPGIIKFWDVAANAPLKPSDFTIAANKEPYWVCEKGHHFSLSITVAVRSFLKSGKFCPICSGNRVTKDNALSSLAPQIAQEWHPTKNLPLTPNDVTLGSTKTVWWVCSRGHEFTQAIEKRTTRKQGCPYCSGRKATLETNLAVKFPEVAKEWHTTKNEGLTPQDVTFGSGKRVWWLCKNGHEWQTQICNRTHKTKPSNCPECFKISWQKLNERR